jgi:serine/threonine-protein kinase
MADDAHLDAICTEYLERLRASLGNASAEDRRQILDQVSEHISSARAALPQQSEVAVREILERLGTPEEIAASAALEDGDPPLAPHRRNRSLVGLAAALVVIGVGIAALAGAFTSSTPPTTVRNILSPVSSSSTRGSIAVPSIVGQQFVTATQEIAAVGLGYEVTYVISNKPIGTVLSQQPSGGTKVGPASKVRISASGTQVALIVPSVIGQPEAQAEAALSATGLQVQVVTQPGGSPSPGTVTEETPLAGSKVPSGSTVVLTVS